MKLSLIEAHPIQLPRDLAAATGSAGSPTTLSPGQGHYRWSSVFPCLYSDQFETAVVRIRTDVGIDGFGEAQAPIAPQVACTIIEKILRPALEGFEFDPTPQGIAIAWNRMYSAMRVRGQTGGFMLDAISGIDLALWDIAGKAQNKNVAALLSDRPKTRIPAYLSGLKKGEDPGPFERVKLFFDTADEEEFLARVPRGAAVDALWRLKPESALTFAKHLESIDALWLEAPLMPEDPQAHADLAAATTVPIAIGESYRTRFEMRPFFEKHALKVFQPDLGRTGISEAIQMEKQAHQQQVETVPHVSIAFGPQVAAAIHFAAAAPSCDLLEFNPQVFRMANRYLKTPLLMDGPNYQVPLGPGLGIDPVLP
jgi:D-galactarolactone cycloisomerase